MPPADPSHLFSPQFLQNCATRWHNQNKHHVIIQESFLLGKDQPALTACTSFPSFFCKGPICWQWCAHPFFVHGKDWPTNLWIATAACTSFPSYFCQTYEYSIVRMCILLCPSLCFEFFANGLTCIGSMCIHRPTCIGSMRVLFLFFWQGTDPLTVTCTSLVFFAWEGPTCQPMNSIVQDVHPFLPFDIFQISWPCIIISFIQFFTPTWYQSSNLVGWECAVFIWVAAAVSKSDSERVHSKTFL